MSNSEDLSAIKSFFDSQILNNQPRTITGKNVLAQWQHWIPTVSTFLYVSDDDLKEAKRLRDQFNLAESPKAFTAVATSPQLSPEETQWFKDMPIVDTTGMSPSDAKAAVWNTKNTREPPESLKKLGFTGTLPADSKLAGSHKTIQQGSKNADVGVWQQVIGVTANNTFDAATRKATVDWQIAHGLKGDGIVGPRTWTMALQYANPNGTPLPSFDDRATSVSGGNTIPYAIASAPASLKGHAAAVALGKATGAQANKLAKEFNLSKEREKLALSSMVPTNVKKVPAWAWAGAAAAVVAGMLYAVFGKPKTIVYNKDNQ